MGAGQRRRGQREGVGQFEQGVGEVGLTRATGPINCHNLCCTAARWGPVDDEQGRVDPILRCRDVHLWTVERHDRAVMLGRLAG